MFANGAYDLEGYLNDADCLEDCGGADRWFELEVPAGELLIVDAQVDIVFTWLRLFDVSLNSCQALPDPSASAIVGSTPTQLVWFNGSVGAASMRMSLQNEWGGTTVLNARTAVLGCGDGHVDSGGRYGPSEECDDANMNEFDGCAMCQRDE